MAANDNMPYIVEYASEFQGGWFASCIFVEEML